MPTAIRNALATALVASCASAPTVPPAAKPSALDALATAIVRACPPSSPGDEAARDACADNLAGLAALRDAAADPILWGGQREPGGYDLEELHLTRLNPYVWRRMYLSLFMFPGAYTVEQAGGGATVVRLAARFRHQLDPGSYPYPFWHSRRKWAAYENATEVVLVLREGKLRGGLRSVPVERPAVVEREWDGHWRWNEEREPHVALYRAIFSPANPHVAELEAAYRALEGAMRPYQCTSCHAPDNKSGMDALEILVYPNQALSARHSLVRAIEEKRMPPETADAPAGIADPVAREKVLQVARAFAAAAELALAYEGEPR